MDLTDTIALVGILLVAIGAGLIYVPAGLIVLGAELIGWALLEATSAALPKVDKP